MKLSLAPNRSYKITLPKKIIEALNWADGDDIDIEIQGKKILLKNKRF